MSVIAEIFGHRVASPDEFPELKQLLARIKDQYDPINVVLYGSQARGDATAQSDWDLKVIVPDEAPDRLFSPMFGWRVQEGSGVFADVSCARISEFREDLGVANSAASHMVDDGVVLSVS